MPATSLSLIASQSSLPTSKGRDQPSVLSASNQLVKNVIVKATDGDRVGQIGFIAEVEFVGTTSRVSWVSVTFSDKATIRLRGDKVERVGDKNEIEILMKSMQTPEPLATTQRFVCPRLHF